MGYAWFHDAIKARTESESRYRISQAEALFRLNQMRIGPYYDPNTQTLRVPYRYRCDEARKIWHEKKMRYDADTHEYYVHVDPQFADAVTKRARKFFFDLYRVIDPRITPLKDLES